MITALKKVPNGMARLGLAELAERERSLLAALDELLARRAWSAADIERHKTLTLQSLLSYAIEHVPLYREKYAGFDPREFRSLADLAKIPALTKDELRNAPVDKLRAGDRPRLARLVKSSGSTGIPSSIFRDEASLWTITAASLVHYREWCGGKPIDNVLYFLDPSPDSIDGALADLLRTTVGEDRIRALDESPAEQMRTLLDVRPEFLSTYPSTVRNLAIALLRRGRTYPRLRLLHLTSEMLDGRTRRLLREVFPAARIVESYASTEGGLMASPCREGRWHVAEDRIVFEIDGDGEVVVTDLTNWTTPIIRYRGLGDACRWDEAPCPCGSKHRVIRLLAGRITVSIGLPGGSFRSPFQLTNRLDEITGIYQYQLVQRTLTDIEVRIVPEPDAVDSAIRADVLRSMARTLPAEVEVRVEFVDSIAARGRHKVPLVVSHLWSVP